MVSGGLIGLANLLIGAKGGGHGSDVTESELLAMADVAVEDEVIETGGAGAHPLDHRVR